MSLKRFKIGPRLLRRRTNRKSIVLSISNKINALDDFEWPKRTCVEKNRFMEPIRKTLNEESHILLVEKYSSMSLVSRNVRCMQNFCGYLLGFLREGASNDHGVVDDDVFWHINGYFFGNFGDKDSIIMWISIPLPACD